MLPFHREPRCREKWSPVRRRAQIMVIPLSSPATTAGAISRATRRAGPVFVRGCVTRRLFGITKSRSSRLASHKKPAPARPRMKWEQTLTYAKIRRQSLYGGAAFFVPGSVDEQVSHQFAAWVVTVVLEVAHAVFAQQLFVDQQAAADRTLGAAEDGVSGISHDCR